MRAYIQKERIQKLNEKEEKQGKYLIYWMQQSQRTEYNHALEYAIVKANQRKLPLIVYFELIENFPEANERHYHFMFEGLKEVKEGLRKRGIKFIIARKSDKEFPDLLKLSKNTVMVVTDRGYLRMQKKWRKDYANKLNCPLIQVESDVIVPVDEVSQKEEYTAFIFRKRISPLLKKYLVPVRHSKPKRSSLNTKFPSFQIDNVDKAVQKLKIDHSVKKSEYHTGGISEAKKHLRNFLKNKLKTYEKFRNDPTEDNLSNLSPYLHFGQISPLYITLQILVQTGRISSSPANGRPGGVFTKKSKMHHSHFLDTKTLRRIQNKNITVFLNQLITQRELCINFVNFNKNYDSYKSLQSWPTKTLEKHKRDKRKYIYTRKQLENAQTHDPNWNAAQMEMVKTGKMHGFMRMYWGKKILEWSETPEKAYETALYLNNKYEIDGRDPNGFAGVAWCFGKHDRPFKERKIYGIIRYMSSEGLRRKFDVEKYVEKIKNFQS